MYIDVGVPGADRERRKGMGVDHGQEGRLVQLQISGTSFNFDQLGLTVCVEPKTDARHPSAGRIAM